MVSVGSTSARAAEASLSGKPSAIRASRASSFGSAVAGTNPSILVPYLLGAPTLSRRSTITRSADFLPTPEAFAIKLESVLAIALRTSSGVPRLNIDMAAFGPTLLTEISNSNRRLAVRLEKPYSSSLLSRIA